MKLTEKQLRRLIREAILENQRELNEGIFGGALKGLFRSIPGVGNIAADAHTSRTFDKLDKKLTSMDKRIRNLEEILMRLGAAKRSGDK